MPTRPGALYYLTYDERSWVSIPPEDSDDPFSDQGETRCSVTPRLLWRSEPQGPHVSIHEDDSDVHILDDIEAGGVAYVVLVNYQDGDTFGSTGYWTVAGVCATPERATLVEKWAAKEDHAGAWRSWDGYFAYLNSADTTAMAVLP